MPLMAKIGVLAGWVGLMFALCAAILNQICLRLLLGWHGYMYVHPPPPRVFRDR